MMTPVREFVHARFSVDGSATPEQFADALEQALERATQSARDLAAVQFPDLVEIGREVTPVPMSVGQEFTVTITLGPKTPA